MQAHILALETVSEFPNYLAQIVVKGIREPNMADHALLEESEWPDALGAVNDLVRHDKVPRLDRLLQTAYSGEGNDSADTDGAESRDVGAGGNLMRCEFVVQAMAGEESDRDRLP